MNATFDRSNSEQVNAYNMIAKTNRSFYLTGRAGTGKTTFLRYIQEEVEKRFVVLAPTGVAAFNAGGQTIHSFFGLGFGPQVPGEFPQIKKEKREVIKNIDAIIIDEVSMVRCDIIDAMDRALRMVRKSSEPFGGLQMIFVGDMYQLEPITTQEDRKILREFYPTDGFYFYNASVIKRYSLPKIEFKRIYRQKDPVFIDLLDHVRKGTVSFMDLQKLNSRFVYEDEMNPKMKITLTTTKKRAQEINVSRLAKLEGEEKTYLATINGDIKNCSGVAEEELALKVGAQVMLTRNDNEGHRWANGTLATVDSMNDESVMVKMENGDVYKVSTVRWDSIEYTYNPETKKTEQKIMGYIIQLPLKLAWAITIHKSQSLTFDRVAVDMGNGAFSFGQTYVALSRCRTLEGLELLSPITSNSIKVSSDVVNFSADCNDNETIERELHIGEAMESESGYTEYDKAAVSLYEMAAQESNKCNYKNAREYMKQALACVVDDKCLQGFEWLAFESDNIDNQILNATGLYYDGRKGEAEFILSSYGSAIDDNLDALYVLSRCYEDREDWEAVESTYQKMLAIQVRYFESGQDSPSFRKMRYRLAILNEKVFGDPGAGLMRQLITENPGYDKFHQAMRWMLANNEDAIEDAQEEDEDNVLVKMMFDKEVDDDSYMTKLNEEREGRTKLWSGYRSFINNIGLTMPY